tara:strand:+ start:2687 stop:3076 length:390 start_codon:yes stop_codon:yes gene_type:complete
MKRIDMFIHFAEIAAKNNITVKFSTADPSQAYWANREHRMISTRPIKNTGYYVSGLHEIGHIVGECQTSKYSLLKQEWYAWKYAMQTAEIWTATTHKIMKRAMKTYIAVAKPKHISRMPDCYRTIFGEL